jgi:hypothetical protein
MSKCDDLLGCDYVIPVKEWKLAPRMTDTNGNVTSTQIELSELELPISRGSQVPKVTDSRDIYNALWCT